MNKKNKVKVSGWSTSIAVMVLTFLIGAAAELGDGFVVVILALGVAAVAIYVAAKNAKKTREKEQSLEEKFTPRRAVKTSCEYSELNCDFSHDYESRVQQLDSFLKNGIIDRAEYNVLLKKYKKNYEEHSE